MPKVTKKAGLLKSGLCLSAIRYSLFFLEQEKNVIESANNVVIFNSRHTNFSTVSALSEEYSDHEDQITLDVNANYEVDVESVVKQVCFNTAALLQKIG